VGPDIDAFEQELEERIGGVHAVALSSGTAAIELALRLVGVGPGDVVIAPSFTFIGTVGPIVHLGARPVFVDSESDTWNIDPAIVEEELRTQARAGQRVAAVIAVDIYGQCADYERLVPICLEQGVPLLEDAAEALGSTRSGAAAGSFGDLSIISFNGNKIITTSTGGMLLSSTRSLIERARYLATQARLPAPHYEHEDVGFNYRMSNLCAAVGRGQLRSLDEKVARRRAVCSRYQAALGSVDGVSFMPEAPQGMSTRWLTVIQVNESRVGVSRQAVQELLDRDGIEVRPAWKPMHLQPVFRSLRMLGGDICAEIFRQGLCLPSGSGLSDDDLDYVIACLLRALGR